MKRLVIAIVLTCSIAATTWAGEVHTPGAPSPQEIPGEIHTPGIASPQDPTLPGEGHTPGAPAPAGGEVPTGGMTEMILTIVGFMFG